MLDLAGEIAADRVAARVMAGVPDRISPAGASRDASGLLPPDVRAFMEPRLGADLRDVRVHTGPEAAARCSALGARAFAFGAEVWFGAGRGPGIDALTAHELAHVVQQRGRVPFVAPKLELRPPGKGEASAWDRRQELVDRLDKVCPSLAWSLTKVAPNREELKYDVWDASLTTHFDKQMVGFIDRADVVPMRLITHEGLVESGDPAKPWAPLFGDSFVAAYVDLDDIMADDDWSFMSDLLHFLTERFQVKDYARLIGVPAALGHRFEAAHQAGKNAEAAQLQYLFRDDSIYFNFEESKPDGSAWVNAFRSRKFGYRAFQVALRPGRATVGGTMWVQKNDGKKVSMEDFIKERSMFPAIAP